MEAVEKFRKGLNKLIKGANEIMDAFLEVTEKIDGIKVCIPVKSIKSVSSDRNGNCFIETGVDKDGNATGIYCKDLYSQVIAKLIKFVI